MPTNYRLLTGNVYHTRTHTHAQTHTQHSSLAQLVESCPSICLCVSVY